MPLLLRPIGKIGWRRLLSSYCKASLLNLEKLVTPIGGSGLPIAIGYFSSAKTGR